MFDEDSDLKELVRQRTLELRASEARFHNIVSISTDGIVIVDSFGIILFVNPAAKSLFGRKAEELLGKPFGFPIVEGETTELDIANREGKRTIAEMRVVAAEWERKPAYLATLHDITERKEVETTLRHDSTHDVLTGLYNRMFFDAELERYSHGRMFPIGLVMADVNGLKTVNDTLGHEAGDNLIRMAARIILGAFRAGDIVARIGGDEFAVLLPKTDKNVAEEAVKRIMSCPEISTGLISIAFGIASAENKDQLAEALTRSDERMYRDKSEQKEL